MSLALLPPQDQCQDAATRLAGIYAAEIDRLVALATVLTRDSAAAEDLAQEVFVRALRAAQSDPDYLRDSAWPWLRTVLIRLNVDRRRRLLREAAKLARLRTQQPQNEWPPDTTAFVEALGSLPPRMRACVALFYGEDLPVAEVASTMRCSTKTVENQLRTARARLAVRLSP